METPTRLRYRFTITHLSLLVALASFGAAMFQGYINSRNLEVVQRDISRREHIRACKEAIEAFFDAKLRIVRLAHIAGSVAETSEFETAMSVSHVGAIGTYLANFQGEDARYQYTLLTRELQRLVDVAKGGAKADDSFFKTADEKFNLMNADCVHSSQLSMQ